MWLSQKRYEELVKAAVHGTAIATMLDQTREELARERDRADRAIEAMMAVKELPSLMAPGPMQMPDVDALPEGMFGDDPEVLAEWAKSKRDEMSLLMEEGGPRE